MGESGPTPSLATTPTIENLSVPLANTEVSYAFPAKTFKFTMKARGAAQIQFAFVASQSSTNFISLKAGAGIAEDDLDLNGTVLYLQTNLPSQTIEILSWQRP